METHAWAGDAQAALVVARCLPADLPPAARPASLGRQCAPPPDCGIGAQSIWLRAVFTGTAVNIRRDRIVRVEGEDLPRR